MGGTSQKWGLTSFKKQIKVLTIIDSSIAKPREVQHALLFIHSRLPLSA